jgi:hypothetical protein
VVQFGLRAKPVQWEIPSTSSGQALRFRLKNGCAQDDAASLSGRTAPLPKGFLIGLSPDSE